MSLLPNETLIYESAEGVVYAKYRDRPEIQRWIVGGNATAIAKAQGYLSYDQWKELFLLAEKNSTLKKQLDKTLDIYYLIKDKK